MEAERHRLAEHRRLLRDGAAHVPRPVDDLGDQLEAEVAEGVVGGEVAVEERLEVRGQGREEAEVEDDLRAVEVGVCGGGGGGGGGG